MHLIIIFFFINNIIGGYVAGYIADNFGRRKALLYSTFILFILQLFSTFMDHFLFFLMMNFMISIFVGIASLTALSYLIEWLPIKNRFMVLSYSQLYPLGMIFLNYFALLAIVEDDMIYWKSLQLSISFLSLSCFFIIKAFCYESPKFLISKQKFNEVFLILDEVGKNANVLLSDTDKIQIMEHAKTEECYQIETSFKELFKGVFIRITLVIISFRLLSSLLNYGSLYILPILLGHSTSHKENTMYDATLGFLYTNLLSLPAPFIRGFLTEIKFLGRKYTILLSCIITLFGFIASLYLYDYMMFFVGFSRLSLTIASGTLVIYNTEAFPTKIRTLALGIISGITRAGAISSPYICFYLVNTSSYACFYCFIIATIFCGFLCLLLPMDTKGLSLDNMNELRKKISNEDFFKIKSKVGLKMKKGDLISC